MSSNNEDAPMPPVVVETDIPLYQVLPQVEGNPTIARSTTHTTADTTAGPAPIKPKEPYGYGAIKDANNPHSSWKATLEGWKCVFDVSSQQYYFYHKKNPKESTWDNPYAELRAPEGVTDSAVRDARKLYGPGSASRAAQPLIRPDGMAPAELQHVKDRQQSMPRGMFSPDRSKDFAAIGGGEAEEREDQQTKEKKGGLKDKKDKQKKDKKDKKKRDGDCAAS